MKKRELKRQIDELRQEVDSLKARIEVLEAARGWYYPYQPLYPIYSQGTLVCTCGTTAGCPIHGTQWAYTGGAISVTVDNGTPTVRQ